MRVTGFLITKNISSEGDLSSHLVQAHVLIDGEVETFRE